MTAPIIYKPTWLPRPEAADSAFDLLWNDLAWVRHPNLPRREYYVAKGGQDYTYGKAEFARTYHSQPLHFAIDYLWQRVEEETQENFDAVFLNGYADGTDHLGWHADNSPEMDDARPIAIVSLGAEREIWFRYVGDKLANFPIEKLKLQHGSLCLMAPGMQDTHQHRIPKAGFVCGPRVSLTFRGMV